MNGRRRALRSGAGWREFIQAVMNPNNPPKDGMYLKCGILNVEGRQNAGKTTQYMVAKDNVYFRTEQYVGNADILTYNEATKTYRALSGLITKGSRLPPLATWLVSGFAALAVLNAVLPAQTL